MTKSSTPPLPTNQRPHREQTRRPPTTRHKAALAEDEHRFRDELVGYLPQLRSVARAMTRSRDGADDLVQETATRALAAYAQFEPGTNLRGWLTTILRNQYISDLRKRHLTVGDDDLADMLATPAAQIHAIELAEVTAAMETLSERHREVLMLVAISEMDQEEAAHRCHCAVGTIKSRLSRARSELHAALAH